MNLSDDFAEAFAETAEIFGGSAAPKQIVFGALSVPTIAGHSLSAQQMLLAGYNPTYDQLCEVLQTDYASLQLAGFDLESEASIDGKLARLHQVTNNFVTVTLHFLSIQ